MPQGPSGFHEYRLRTIFDEMPLPMSWPVLVNYHEAKAFAKWKAVKEEQVSIFQTACFCTHRTYFSFR